MKRAAIVAATLTLALSGACHCGSDKAAGLKDGSLADGSGDGGPGGPGSDGGPGVDLDGATGPGSMCVPEGHACVTSFTPCCSGTCSMGHCTTPIICKGPSVSCMQNSECCENSCVQGACSATLCLGDGHACTSNAECCSTICDPMAHTCGALPPGPSGATCKILGEGCMAGSECCSTNCQGGVCVRAFACQANGDICHQNSDCCGNSCSATPGTAGRCVFVTGCAAGGCVQDGNPCPAGPTNCCSRVCLDLGFGVPVCQLAGGCRLTGDSCASDNDCCGGGMNPNGTATCCMGRCTEGMMCKGVGKVCGNGVNASQDCCDGKKNVCKVDTTGVPRCFGGCPTGTCPATCPTGYDPNNPRCCIGVGHACQFRDQCCNLTPCVPSPSGGFVCAAAPTCAGAGSTCMVGAAPGPMGCCGGTQCIPSTQPGVYVCSNTPPSTGPGADGGPVGGPHDGGPVCAANGQPCSSAAVCCSNICTGGMCAAPMVCQPQGATCSANGDCCMGLLCTASATGSTCEPGATCGALGQACSPTSACCTGLNCVQQGSVTACDGTTACVCSVGL